MSSFFRTAVALMAVGAAIDMGAPRADQLDVSDLQFIRGGQFNCTMFMQTEDDPCATCVQDDPWPNKYRKCDPGYDYECALWRDDGCFSCRLVTQGCDGWAVQYADDDCSMPTGLPDQLCSQSFNDARTEDCDPYENCADH